jgi:hypothetical protein
MPPKAAAAKAPASDKGKKDAKKDDKVFCHFIIKCLLLLRIDPFSPFHYSPTSPLENIEMNW